MKSNLLLSLFICLFAAGALTACSNSSGTSGPRPAIDFDKMTAQNFKGEHEIDIYEYSRIQSEWRAAAGCREPFAAGLAGSKFKVEEAYSSQVLGYSMQLTDQVYSASGSETRSSISYSNVQISGFSGQLYDGNRAERVCTFTATGASTSLRCEAQGELTTEAKEFLSRLPKDPEASCTSNSDSKIAKSSYSTGTYYLENGLRVQALFEKVQSTGTTTCNGKVEERVTSYASVTTGALKAYPGDSVCQLELYSFVNVQVKDGRTVVNATKRVLEAPLK